MSSSFCLSAILFATSFAALVCSWRDWSAFLTSFSALEIWFLRLSSVIPSSSACLAFTSAALASRFSLADWLASLATVSADLVAVAVDSAFAKALSASVFSALFSDATFDSSSMIASAFLALAKSFLASASFEAFSSTDAWAFLTSFCASVICFSDDDCATAFSLPSTGFSLAWTSWFIAPAANKAAANVNEDKNFLCFITISFKCII